MVLERFDIGFVVGKEFVVLSEIEGGWGVYRGTWTPPAGGAYTISIQFPDEDPKVSTTLEIATIYEELVKAFAGKGITLPPWPHR